VSLLYTLLQHFVMPSLKKKVNFNAERKRQRLETLLNVPHTLLPQRRTSSTDKENYPVNHHLSFFISIVSRSNPRRAKDRLRCLKHTD